MRLAGVILSGGRGERLGGVDKGSLEIAGRRLIDRVADRLAGCVPLVIAIGRRQPGGIYGLSDSIEVPDLAGDYAGPLAGLAAAISYLVGLPERPDGLLCVAVDTPALPEDYFHRMEAALTGAPAAVAAYGGQPYPTNSVWRFDVVAGLPAQVLAGTAPHSLKRLADSVGGLGLPWPESAGGDPFASVNSPEDLAALSRRLGAMSPQDIQM